MNWYTPILFGFGLNLISTICFVVIPIFTVLLLFFSKRKFLWMAPFISTFLMFVICVIAEGPSLLSVGEYRGMFLGIVVPIQIAITVIWTVISYIIACILKTKQGKK